MTFLVLVTDRVMAAGLGPLMEDGRFRVVMADDPSSDEYRRSLVGADALIVRSATKVDAELLSKAPGLRVVGRAGVGVDNIDLDAASDSGVAVFNAPDGNTVAAAEMTMALMLAVARRVPEADRSMREGLWDRSRLMGMELRGKTLGILGGGRIGGEVSRLARAFGMEIVLHDPYMSHQRAAQLAVISSGVSEVLEQSDVVSLHVPLSEETRGLLDATAIAGMRPGAILINVSRGGIVDEQALAEALVEGRLGGAALDVFESEPLPPDSPLLGAPGLVLSPHLGASTDEAQIRVALQVAESIKTALVDGDVSLAVNADRL